MEKQTGPSLFFSILSDTFNRFEIRNIYLAREHKKPLSLVFSNFSLDNFKNKIPSPVAGGFAAGY